MKVMSPHRVLPAMAVFAAMSTAHAATFFTEDFSSLTDGPNLALGTGHGSPTTDFSLGNFKITSGANSRIYLGTTDTDYSLTSFVFQATVTVPNTSDGYAIAFLGMGSPNAGAGVYGEPITGSNLFMLLRPDNNNLDSRDNATTATGTVQASGLTVKNTTNMLRMTWDSVTKQAFFEYDAGNNGSIDKSFTLDGSNNSFTGANSQLVLGGGNGLVFDNVSVSAVPEPGTYGLMGAGALAAVAFVRRRRKLAGKVA